MKSFQHIVYFILQKVGSGILLAIGFFLVLGVTFAAVEWPNSGPDGEIEGGIFAGLMKKVLENEDVSDSTNSGTVKYARNSDMVDGLHANELMASSIGGGGLSPGVIRYLENTESCNSSEVEIRSEDFSGGLPPASEGHALPEGARQVGKEYFNGLSCTTASYMENIVVVCGVMTEEVINNGGRKQLYTRFFVDPSGRASAFMTYYALKVCIPQGMKIILGKIASTPCPSNFQTSEGLSRSESLLYLSRDNFSLQIGSLNGWGNYDTDLEVAEKIGIEASLIRISAPKICTYNF